MQIEACEIFLGNKMRRNNQIFNDEKTQRLTSFLSQCGGCGLGIGGYSGQWDATLGRALLNLFQT